MEKVKLPMGKNGATVQFEITEDNHLKLTAVEKGETYKLTFMM